MKNTRRTTKPTRMTPDILGSWWPTGKRGTNIATGLPAVEMEETDENGRMTGRRMWLLEDGRMVDE